VDSQAVRIVLAEDPGSANATNADAVRATQKFDLMLALPNVKSGAQQMRFGQKIAELRYVIANSDARQRRQPR